MCQKDASTDYDILFNYNNPCVSNHPVLIALDCHHFACQKRGRKTLRQISGHYDNLSYVLDKRWVATAQVPLDKYYEKPTQKACEALVSVTSVTDWLVEETKFVMEVPAAGSSMGLAMCSYRAATWA